MFFTEFKYEYLFSKTLIRTFNGSRCDISTHANIRNSKIVVSSGAKLSIGNHVLIENVEIYVEKGSFLIQDHSILQSDLKNNKLKIIINDGDVIIGHHSKISCYRIWVRFGGRLEVGNYTNVNKGSEIRCDENIIIGSYNQISYNVKIWDTNTHNILEKEQRRRIAEDYFPYFGYEKGKPKTQSVKIGDDCWIGENAAILKGTSLGDGSIVGFNTILAGENISPNNVVVQDIILKKLK